MTLKYGWVSSNQLMALRKRPRPLEEDKILLQTWAAALALPWVSSLLPGLQSLAWPVPAVLLFSHSVVSVSL